jgi:hypothetical protein
LTNQPFTKENALNGKRTLLAVATIGFAFASGCADAQTTAVGPYYATPSWDQTTPASTRFVVLTNFNSQAVLDRETGLVWQRSPFQNITAGHEVAITFCLNSTVGGRAGWRLPAAAELGSLIDPTATTVPGFPAGHPFIGFPVSTTAFWTSTVDPEGSFFVMSVVKLNVEAQISYGFNTEPTNFGATIFCVRGPVGAG